MASASVDGGARAAGPHAELRTGAELGLAAGLCALAALCWTLPLSDARAWGWDESMHAELPAVRMLLALRAGELGALFDALHDCDQYPFVWPLVLLLVQLVTGVSEHACRVAGTLAWCATLFGVFLVAREGLVVGRGERAARLAPFLALLVAALSPVALAFSGTLFFEVPATCAAVWTLRAWLVRRRLGTRRAGLCAGAWIAAAFFTKFNYGLMLGLGLALDWLWESIVALRQGELRAQLVRTGWLVLVPALAGAWWFLLPLPGGLELGAEHRQVFAAFLHENRGRPYEPWTTRLLYLGNYLSFTPRLFVLQLGLALVALAALREASVRTWWLVLLASYVPMALHPFHLERFVIVCVPALALLAAAGARRLLASRRGGLALGALLAVALVAPALDREPLAARAGRLSAEPGALRDYQLGLQREQRDLSGGRALPTAGLERAEHEALSALLAAEIGPEERVGWIGMSSEYGPAVLHLALLARGGTPERFRREVVCTLDVDYFGNDPGWDDGRLLGWASTFDLVIWCQPVDLKDRVGRRGLSGYGPRLAAMGGRDRVLGQVSIARPLRDPCVVTVHAWRPIP